MYYKYYYNHVLLQVESLVKVLVTIPCSNAEAERSFSKLRLLKTYLRSTMTQERLNHLAILNVHRDKLDEINIEDVLEEFISRNNSRRTVFGKSLGPLG